MRVWYGYSKLTKKMVRKKELAIYYENTSNGNSLKREEWINKRMHVIHKRNQTLEEMEGSEHQSREFTKYGYFIEDRKFNGDIDKVLFVNSEADKNHVSVEERNIIKNKLKEAYYQCYDVKEIKNKQMALNLF